MFYFITILHTFEIWIGIDFNVYDYKNYMGSFEKISKIMFTFIMYNLYHIIPLA